MSEREERGHGRGMTTDQAVPGGRVTHLAAPGRPGVAACGRWSKFTTMSAAGVTCAKCRETWDFALAEAKSGPPVDEEAFRRKLDDQAQEIVRQINAGTLTHAMLPEGMRFEWTS